MKLLDKYIAKTVLASIFLVILLLSGLQLFILFVNQLADLNKGDYSLSAALYYVMLNLPYEVYLFFPMASLLGCLIGLGNLANHHELVVMRAAGMSIGRISFAIFKVAILLIIVVSLIGEIVLPNWVRTAHQYKLQAISGGQSLDTSHGVWVRYQNDFIKIGEIDPRHHLKDVQQFHFDSQHNLVFSRHIDDLSEQSSSVIAPSWRATGIVESWIYEHTTKTVNVDEMTWEIPLLWSVVGVSQRQADEMTIIELYHSVKAQKTNNMSSNNELLVYYQRIMQPITTLVMMLLSIPFVFGPLRSSTMGSKLLTGAAVGFGFYIVNRFLGSASQVYQWSYIFAAISPTCVAAGLGCWLGMKTR